MRFAWSVEGDDPDYGQAEKYGLTGILSPMPSVDPLSLSVVPATRNDGLVTGIYLGHDWFPSDTPEKLASRVSNDLKRFLGWETMRAMFNMEQHDPDYIIAVLEAWRKKHPKTNTSWSPEGMQGGWMSPSFVSRLLACRVRVVPQAFTGTMQRRAEDIVLRDLMDVGIPASSVSLFYDGAQLPNDWDGFVFTTGRLPWIP